jgi:hypothetical protein
MRVPRCAYTILVGKPGRKKQRGDLWHTLEKNIEMSFRKEGLMCGTDSSGSG